MRDAANLLASLLFSSLFFFLGLLLIRDAASSTVVDPTANIVAGALLVSVGVTIVSGALRNWWKLRKKLQPRF
jgi:hypothetical protein